MKQMVGRPEKLIPAILMVGTCLFNSFQTKAQLGPNTLQGPGIAINADYMPASRYIRPEDSVKTRSTTTIRRLSMIAAFNLATMKDTSTGKFRQWALGLRGSYMDLSNEKYENPIMPDKLLGVDLALMHVRSLRNKWSLMMMASIGLYSDLEEINSKDFFVNGGVLFVKQANARFSYGFGAVLTNSFGTPMVLPGLLANWNSGKKLRVNITFPEQFKVSYNLNDFFETAIAVRMNGGAYDVEKRKDNRRLMGYKELTAGWENSFHVSKRFSVNIAAGGALLRSVDFRRKSLSEMFKTQPEHKLATGLFASAGLRMHFNQ